MEEFHVDIKQVVSSTCTCRYVRSWLRITFHLEQFFSLGDIRYKTPSLVLHDYGICSAS